MIENGFFKQMMTSIEQLVDERIALKIRELQNELKEKETEKEKNDDYLSVQQLSGLTGLKKATIYAKRSRRELPAYKFGRELRFRRSEIEQWIGSKGLTYISDRRFTSANITERRSA